MKDKNKDPEVSNEAGKKSKLRITRRGFIRLCFLGILGLVTGRGFVNSRSLELAEIKVHLKRLPSAFEGLKVGQITDIHSGPLVPAELIKNGVDLIMARQPDLIVLTGDFVSGATKILFAVLGNHDFWSGQEIVKKIIRGLECIGIKVLRNEVIPVKRGGQQLYIVGVDDYWEDSYNLSGALSGIPEDSCRILLSHNPDVNEDIENQGKRIDFVISGHTHGGQVVLPFAGALYMPSPFGQKYRVGLVRDGERQTYISRGLGLFFVPIRINCPPDVTVLTLHEQQNKLT